jgi:hypothetical protein
VNDGIGLVEKMLGLPGLRVLEVEEGLGDVVVRVESTRNKASSPSYRRGTRARTRVEVHRRNACWFGRPAPDGAGQAKMAVPAGGVCTKDLDRTD